MQIKKKGIITSALTLTLASIITRILGFVYRIYMSNTMGAEGMGLYQLIMPLYSLAWAIACSGFTTTIAKLVAQENAKKEYGNMGRVLKQTLLITCGISVILTILTFNLSGFISETMLGDKRVDLSLKILSLAFPFMTAGSCIRGYFLGLQETKVPAISQVFEQVVRMVFIYILSIAFMPKGLEYACAAAVVGIFFGEFFSFVYVFLAYKFFKKKNGLNKKPTLSSLQTLTLVLTMAAPLGMNRITGSLLATAENILIPNRLQMFGMTQAEALSAYGQITGMALPLIFFPSALLFALSTTLVPAVSEAIALKNTKRVQMTIRKSMIFTLLVGIGAATVFLVFPKELGETIYKTDISRYLFMFGLLCPFWYISITFSGILNGLGEQVFMFRNSLISSAINIGFIFFIVPKYGVEAFIFGWFVSLLVTVMLDAYCIKKATSVKIELIQWLGKPLLASVAAGLLIEYVTNNLIYVLFSGYFALLIALLLLGTIYLIFSMLLGIVTFDDINILFKNFAMFKKPTEKDKSKI